MRLLLVYDTSEALGNAWTELFGDQEDVAVVQADICEVTCGAVVSPANSFGFMDGGLDEKLSLRFGLDLQRSLQDAIAQRPMRELLVGEALVIPTNDSVAPWLISAPTMQVPMRLRQSVNAYLAMKAILLAALAHDGQPKISIVAIPGLGTGCGALKAPTAALQMWSAYQEVILQEIPYPEDFGVAQRRHINLNVDEIEIWD